MGGVGVLVSVERDQKSPVAGWRGRLDSALVSVFLVTMLHLASESIKQSIKKVNQSQ
jgi:hypothetical protein